MGTEKLSPGLAIYEMNIVPLWLETTFLLISIHEMYFVPLGFENHTLVIHSCDIYCTVKV